MTGAGGKDLEQPVEGRATRMYVRAVCSLRL
jgi:hypothetical protein